MAALTESWDARSPDYVGRFRTVATRANAQPPRDDAPGHRAFAEFGLPETQLFDPAAEGSTLSRRGHRQNTGRNP